jgi:hypothetical protein
MTKHFSGTELVDLLEGRLDSRRAAHVDACVRCREEAAGLRETLRSLDVEEVPEPSPAFWNRFSAQVRERVAAAGTIRNRWWPHLAAASACAAAVLVLIVVGTGRRENAASSAPPNVASSPLSEPSPAATAPTVDLSSSSGDAAWALLRDVASDLRLDEASAAGFSAPRGSIEMAVTELTPAERVELERLLRSELRRAGA